jgi:hypothetical protein
LLQEAEGYQSAARSVMDPCPRNGNLFTMPQACWYQRTEGEAMSNELRYREAQLYRETQLRLITGEGDKEVPLSKWDLKRMHSYIRAGYRATTRENVRVLLDEARYLEDTAVELELVSQILDRAGIPEEAGSVPERLRILVLAHEQEIAAFHRGQQP